MKRQCSTCYSIPWGEYVGCTILVYRDGKSQVCYLDPLPMTTADEAFQVMRFLMATQYRQVGSIAWDTVPESVQRHFRFQD